MYIYIYVCISIQHFSRIPHVLKCIFHFIHMYTFHIGYIMVLTVVVGKHMSQDGVMNALLFHLMSLQPQWGFNGEISKQFIGIYAGSYGLVMINKDG